MVFLLGGLALFFARYKSIPDHKKEEELSSREFWMFIGALVLIISSVQITATTSLPVINRIFDTKYAVTDPIKVYNDVQIWVAIVLALGTAAIYYFKFKKNNWTAVIKKLALPLIASLVISSLVSYFQGLNSAPVAILMFCGVFTVIANVLYISQNQKWKVKKWGGNVAHLGFGFMLIGILISSYNKNVISLNTLGVEFDMGKENAAENRKESRENVLLFRGKATEMDGYWLTYMGDTTIGPDHFYSVRYIKKDGDKIIENFILKPNAQINPKMGLVSNPDTKHYLTKDVLHTLLPLLTSLKSKTLPLINRKK